MTDASRRNAYGLAITLDATGRWRRFIPASQFSIIGRLHFLLDNGGSCREEADQAHGRHVATVPFSAQSAWRNRAPDFRRKSKI
jgi:hypothetical protein